MEYEQRTSSGAYLMMLMCYVLKAYIVVTHLKYLDKFIEA